jgi:hypothetical protein
MQHAPRFLTMGQKIERRVHASVNPQRKAGGAR